MEQVRTGCPGCAAELDHCHGTLVTHDGYLVECSEPGCRDIDLARHELVLHCWDVDGTCVCGQEPAMEFAVAS